MACLHMAGTSASAVLVSSRRSMESKISSDPVKRRLSKATAGCCLSEGIDGTNFCILKFCPAACVTSSADAAVGHRNRAIPACLYSSARNYIPHTRDSFNGLGLIIVRVAVVVVRYCEARTAEIFTCLRQWPLSTGTIRDVCQSRLALRRLLALLRRRFVNQFGCAPSADACNRTNALCICVGRNQATARAPRRLGLP